MEKINYKELKDVIKTYNSLDKNEKEKVNNEIEKIWFDTYRKFGAKCKSDKELNELFDFINDFQMAVDFNYANYYRKLDYVANEFEEDSKNVYAYDLDAHLQAEEIYNNLDKLKADLQSKIDKINSSKVGIGKSWRIQRLKDKIIEYEGTAKRYKELKDREDKKREYEETRFETYISNIDKVKVILNNYAEEIVSEALKENPGLICVEHYSHFPFSGYGSYSMSSINKVCNDIRKETLNLIKEDKDKLFGDGQPTNE